MAASGFEPDVYDVHLFAKFRAAAFATLCFGTDELLRRFFVPYVGGMFAEQCDHAVEHLAAGERLLASLAIKDGNRHAPETLARDAPIGAKRDHVGHALLAPLWNPLHLPDRFEGAPAQIVSFHADEPLFRRAENGGIVAAPAVRVT